MVWRNWPNWLKVLLIIAILLVILNSYSNKKMECSQELDDCYYYCEDILFSGHEDSYTEFTDCKNKCNIKLDNCGS